MYEVYCLKYAESVLTENMVFFGGSKEKEIPISFAIYLIKTEDKNILIDSGCDTMPGFVMKDFYSPAIVLNQAGLSAKEITDVILTHAHHDHIEAINHFTNAVVHITTEAYSKGKKYISEKMQVHIFDEEYIIDPQIKVIKVGGHTTGSAIVEMTCGDITHVFAGDECYTNDNIIKKIPTGSSRNLVKSREFVEKYSDEKYRVHTCHDISLKTEKII